MKRHGKTILSLILILISVIIFLYNFNISEIMATIHLIPGPVILLAFFLHLLTLVLGALKWYLMLAGIGQGNKPGLIFKIHISTIFFDNLTPGARIGGEGVRLYLTRNLLGIDYASITGLIGLDKVLTLIPFILLCLLALVWQGQFFQQGSLFRGIFIVLSLLVLLVIIAIVALLKLGKKKGTDDARLSRFKSFLANAGHSFRLIFTRKRGLLPLLFLSSIIWFIYLLKIYILAEAIGINIAFKTLSSASILAYLVGILPLTPGGLGLFDGTLSGFLLLFNADKATVGSLVLLYRLTTYFFTLLLGGLASIILFNKVLERKNIIDEGGFIGDK